MSTTIGKVTIPLSEMMQRLTVLVTVSETHRTSFRLWAGIKIMRLAVAVIGCKIEVEIKP